jgi:universal stress protein E
LQELAMATQSVLFDGYRRILVATDFSPPSEAALRQAAWVARQGRAKLVLAHVLPSMRQAVLAASREARKNLFYGSGELFQHEVRQESEARLRQNIEPLRQGGLDVSCEVLIGTPFLEITYAVQKEGYDLVMTGTRGLGVFEQLFVGSTAQRLIRKCPAAVWVVKSEHADPPKVVLAATDLSDVSRKAVWQGYWVAQQAEAEFHLLHVIDAQDVPEGALDNIPPGGSLVERIEAEARKRFDEFVASLGIGSDRLHTHLEWGTPWEEIRTLARQRQVDLIALGTVGRSGIRGVLLGNTAEKVLTTCDCSLLTVKPDDFVSPIDPPFWPLHPEATPAEP